MNAKEKAIELVEKYKEYAHRPQSYLCYARRDEADWHNNAKQCALIAVEEILKLNMWVDALAQKDQPDFSDEEDTEEFWEAVKHEIENM